MELTFFHWMITSLVVTSCQLQEISPNQTSVKEIEYAIVDTDTAVDDALAIALLSSRPEWKILAITTVFGNLDVDQSSINALRTLNTMGKTDVAVYQGAHRPLVHNTNMRSAYYFGKDGLGNKGAQYPEGNMTIEEQHAVQALIQLVRDHPGQVNIIALGPLTNLALAQRLDHTFLRNVKDLFIMGGNLHGTGNLQEGYPTAAEYNFFHDPEAAHIVISESVKKPEIFTLEMCIKGGLSWDFYERIGKFNTMTSCFLRDINEFSSNHYDIPNDVGTYMSCDLFAVATVVNRKIAAEVVSMRATVELNGRHTRGMLVLDKNPFDKRSQDRDKHNVDIVFDVDLQELEKTILEMVQN